MNTQNQTSSTSVSLISNEDDVMIVEIRGKDFSPRNLALARDVSELVARSYKYVYPMGDKNGVVNDGETPVSGVAFVGAAPSDIDRDNVVFVNNFLRLVAESGQQPDYYGLVPLGSKNLAKKTPIAQDFSGGLFGKLWGAKEEENHDVRAELLKAAEEAGFVITESEEVSFHDLFARVLEAAPDAGELPSKAKNPAMIFAREDIGVKIEMSTSPVAGTHLKLTPNKGMYRPSVAQLHCCSATMELVQNLIKQLGMAKDIHEVNRIWAVFSLFLTDRHLKFDPNEIDVFIEPSTLHFYIVSVELGVGFYVEPFAQLAYILTPRPSREAVKSTTRHSQERMTAMKKVEAHEVNLRRRGHAMRLSLVIKDMFEIEMVNDIIELIDDMERIV